VEGIQSWRINCTDEAGNENQSPIWTINVDRTDPSIILSSPENNSWTNSTTINYNFTPDDNLAPQLSCGLYVAGILRNSSIFPPGITAILQNDTEEGNIPWWVNCSDLADNTNQSPVWTINVDRTFPSIIILSPTYSTTYDEEIDVTVVVDGTGSPPKAVTIDGKNVTPDSLLGNVGTYSKKVGLDLGENNIVVNATDSAENKNNTTIFIKRNPLPTPAPAVAAGGGGAAAPEKTPTPAEIKIVKIEIIPTKVRVGESVTINVYVKNSGESSGKITVVLKIAGIEEESETVSVSGLETKIVTFTTAKEEIGTYDVEVNGQAGSFTVIPKVATLEKKTEEATIESIEEGTDKTIEFTRPDVSKITLNLKRALKNVRIIIQTLAEIPVETLKDVPGRLYTYFEIISNIKDEDINSVVIEFKVSKSWIEDARINKTRISLFRFDDGRWDPLNTILEREEPEHIFYKVRTDRLSIFAVAGEMEVEAPPPPFPRIPIDWTPVGVLTAALMVSVIVIIMIGGAVYREEISALFRRRKEV
jgi:PGF-pre-PGF domain-containing protein